MKVDVLNCLDRCLEKAMDISDNILDIVNVNFNMMYDNGFTILYNSFSLTNLIKEPICSMSSPSLLDIIIFCNPKPLKNTANISLCERCQGGTKNQHFRTTVKPLISNRHASSFNSVTLMEENEIISDHKLVSEIYNNYFTNIANTHRFF